MHHSISDLAMANDAGLQHGLAGVFRVMIPYVEHVKRVQDSLLVASARSVVMYILCACAATSVGAMAHAWGGKCSCAQCCLSAWECSEVLVHR